jgi:RNA polymerase sigma factor (sigma-70 family)
MNKALDHVRSRNARRETLSALPAGAEFDGVTPVQAMAHAEDRAVILEFVQALPEREAEAITLFALEDLDYTAVARAMGCSQVTVRVLIGRARRRFRKAFGAGRSQRFLTNPQPTT